MNFGHLLVPLDLTPKNVEAVTAAGELASEGTQVTLLHVIEKIDLPDEEVAAFYRRLEERARTEMGKHARTLEEAGVSVECQVAYGPRAREIVHYALREDVGLIVLSSRRIDPARPEHNWATISHKVAILAQCPVLLVK